MAHRGLSASFPENTRASFDAALLSPIDAMELDVQMASDDVPVVFHDRSTAKLGLRGRKVSSFTLNELQRRDAGSWFARRFRGERIMTLEGFLRRYGGRTRLMIEIKARNAAKESARLENLTRSTIAQIQRFGLTGSSCLLSFSLPVLDHAKALCPAMKTIWNLSSPPKSPDLNSKRFGRLFGVCLDVREISTAFVTKMHRRRKAVFTYTCNSDRSLKSALGARVDGIFSDRADWLIDRVAGSISSSNTGKRK